MNRIALILAVALLSQPSLATVMSDGQAFSDKDSDLSSSISMVMEPRTSKKGLDEIASLVERVKNSHTEMLPGVSYTLAAASKDNGAAHPVGATTLAESSLDILTPGVAKDDPDQTAEILVVLASAVSTIESTGAIDQKRLDNINKRIDNLVSETSAVMDEESKSGVGGGELASRVTEARESAPVGIVIESAGLDWKSAAIGLAAVVGGAVAFSGGGDSGDSFQPKKEITQTPKPEPTPSPVPIPGAALLFISGLGFGLGTLRRLF